MRIVFFGIMAGAIAPLFFSSAWGASFKIPKGQKSLIAFWKCNGGGVSFLCKRKICFSYVNASDQNPGVAHLFREAKPGGGKDLDIHPGGRCLDTKGRAYWVYAMPLSEDLVVTVSDDVAP
ncbi:hypothetical protein [Bosea sp. (in: a-proteobacteria)]|jgi:hypothetical protein|uniref:hypothetical protein n=1 Tax=Bosea sp. (in: a-proteobacteria) TaxID=1871050 RepID=UPI002DDCCF60|nr:hypothetical protein [Bosea sp. (in: a-proteobacteria)]HEV2508301.1 hypothetical protein [Bosea sp. (in: a-proteobacteria)]